MRKILIGIAFTTSLMFSSNVHAQQTPPPGSGDKNMGDDGIKLRSVDLERAKRDAQKTGSLPANPAKPVDPLAEKYDEIKTDYEQIQMSLDAVIKAYQGSGEIDHAQISKSALEIKSSAARLDANLFPSPPVDKTEAKNEKMEKTKSELKTTKSLRDLIIDLDNAVGGFTTSPMFQNLRAVDAAVSEKAKLDLEKIKELSALLDAEARKAVGGK